MSKDLFSIIRERDLIRESKREELDHYLRVLHLREFNNIYKHKLTVKKPIT